MTTAPHGSTQPITISRFSCLLLLLLLGIAERGWATPLVTASYVRLGGQEIAIKIVINAPPPPSLIVTQHLPPGVSVVRAQPATSSVNSDKGEVKWLLSGVKPGTLAVLLTLDQAVASSQISGDIRYRDPVSGRMVTLPMAKP